MNALFTSVLALLFLIGGCEKESKTEAECGTGQPLEELVWLQNLQKSFEMRMGPAAAEIVQYRYKGEVVFYVDDCYMCPDAMQVVYNCAGQEVCRFGGFAGLNTCPDFFEEATNKTVLFSSIQP